MFTELQDLFQNTDITTIQLHASDYELALRQLLTVYGDRHEDSPIFYWNNGYQRNFQIDKTAKAMHREGYSPVEPVIYWVQIRETPSKSKHDCCSVVG